MIDPARKHVVGQRAAPPFQPRKQAGARVLHQLELHRLARLRLDDDGTVANLAAQHEIADPDFHHVAATKLAVDRQVQTWRGFSAPRSDLTPRVPGWTIASRIEL